MFGPNFWSMRSNNEHTELIKGTPWLRFWPRGTGSGPKRYLDVELRSVESILDFLDEQDRVQPQSPLQNAILCVFVLLCF